MNKMMIWAVVVIMAMPLCSCSRNNIDDQQEVWDPRVDERVDRAYQGDPESQYLMGVCCDNEHSYSQAVSWYAKAAEQGHKYAQYQLGDCFFFGIGVERSLSDAVKWYRESAQQGVACAQDNLANCYFEGDGVSQSVEDALYWYRMAASSGNTHAMNSIATIYYYGFGVDPSADSATYWFTMSANWGDSIALIALEHMSRM